MKKIPFIIILFLSIATQAQVKQAVLQASGLTCSMCSNAINKSLQSLDFVKKVEANIKNSSFEITFNPDRPVDFDRLKKKVEDAGFFVAALTATINFTNVALENDSHVQVDGTTFHFLNTKDQLLNGERTIRLLDKGFVSAKEYKANSKFTLMACYKTGLAGACCSKEGPEAGTRIFHATI